MYHYSLESKNTGILYVASVEHKRLLFKIWFSDRTVVEVKTTPTDRAIVDLNRKGTRWEGEVYERQPYGWGCLYDEYDNLVYEGFIDGSDYIVYGTNYDKGNIAYRGQFCFGKKMGYGFSMDYHKVITFDGLWIDSNPINLPIRLENHSMIGVHSHVAEMALSSNKNINNILADYHTIEFYQFYELTTLVIADNFLSSLEETLCDQFHFTISHCLALESITIGNNSLCCFSSCTISDLPYLASLKFGGGTDGLATFWACSSLVIKSNIKMLVLRIIITIHLIINSFSILH